MPSLFVRQNVFVLPLALAAVLAAVSTSSAARNPGSHGPQPPSNTSAPTVTGTPVVGATLAATVGSWSGGSIAYKLNWQRCDATAAACAPIAGATAASYAVQATDAGASLRVMVLATNKSGTISADSVPTALVTAPTPPAPTAAPAPVNTAAPQINGTTIVGQSLNASSGSWNPSAPSLGYHWSRCNSAGSNCAPIGGATASTFTLGPVDTSATMRVVVTASDAGGSTTATSAASPVVTTPPPVVAAPLATAPVAISGTPQVGQTLTVSQGTWSGSPTAFADQWQRCDAVGASCAPISGAAAASYVLAPADAGTTIRASVTASNAGGSTVSLSAATTPVTNPSAPAPPADSRFGIAAGGNLHNLSSTDLNHYFDLLQASHVGWIRFDINWSVVQNGGPTSYNWAPFDNVVRAATAHNIKTLGIILYTPGWARPSGTSAATPPTTLSNYADFAGAVARHYLPLGVHAYEIWNEPNIGEFWSPSPDAARYTQLLKLAYAAIKQVDSGSTVISAGLSGYGVYNEADATHMNPINFLERMYANGAKSAMDGVGWHPYAYPYGITYEPWSGWSQMNQTSPSARSVMIANGDAGKQLWATEFGEPTGTATKAVTEAAQAAYVTAAYAALKGVSWAGPAFLYSGWDYGTDLSNVEHNFGIIRHDWSLKPSYSAYSSAAAAG